MEWERIINLICNLFLNFFVNLCEYEYNDHTLSYDTVKYSPIKPKAGKVGLFRVDFELAYFQ